MRSSVRRLLGLALLVSVVTAPAAHVLAPRVAACSCEMPQPLAATAAEPDVVSVLGVAGHEEPAGVPVRVTRWFRGAGIAPVVWLDPTDLQGGDDGGLCGTDPLTPGVSWVIVAWRFEGRLSVGMCTPHARADDPVGRQMLQDLTAAFGPGIPVTQESTENDMATVQALTPLIIALVTIAAVTLSASAAVLAMFAIRSRRREP